MGLLLALDAGGTHTRCALLTLEGRVLSVGEGGPANWSTLGAEVVCRSVREAVAAAHLNRGLGEGDLPPPLAGVCVALAGYYPPWHRAEATAALAPILGARVRLEPDLKAAWAGATALGPGVVVVAGTGSVAYGEDGAGRTARAGGWGPLAGDEGSAPWIGAAALRAVGRALDGRGPETALVEAIPLPLPSGVGAERREPLRRSAPTPDGSGRGIAPRIEERLRAIYRDRWGRAEVSALAPKVAAVAADGDAVAQEIMTRAAGALGELALTVLRSLGLECGPTTVSLAGGVAAAGAPLLDPFHRWLAMTAPGAVVTPPRFSPLEGAALLALEAFAGKSGTGV